MTTTQEPAQVSVLARLAVRVEQSAAARDAVLYALYVLHRMPVSLRPGGLPPLYDGLAAHGNYRSKDIAWRG